MAEETNTLILDGVDVEMREDGMINATQLCKAGGKKWNNFIRLEGTKEFIKELKQSSYSNSAMNSDILTSKNGGKIGQHGTWVCKELAIKLAAWISPKFEVQVMRWAYEILDGNIGSIIPEVINNFDRNNNTTSMVKIDTKSNQLTDKLIINNDQWEREITLREKELMAKEKEINDREKVTFMQMFNLWQSFGLDERDELLAKDLVKNKLIEAERTSHSSQLLLTDSKPEIPQEKELTISTVSADMGYKLSLQECKEAGKMAKSLFYKKHNHVNIPKRDQWVEGATRHVNVYYKEDLDIVKKAINLILKRRKSKH